jgi:hypothetical protein
MRVGRRRLLTQRRPTTLTDVDAKSEELQGTLSEMANETWDAIER